MDEETLVIKETLLEMVAGGDLLAHCPKCDLPLTTDELNDSCCTQDGEIDFEAIIFKRRDLLPEA